MENIRNFVVIAHIDHGKSTLADRFLELTGTIEKRKMREQFLDQMDLERERGITIKLQPVRMEYNLSGQEYILNLIDTPGHVDFSYEVSRSLAAVEGAILLVDATKGVQAQTLANLFLAQMQGLVIIPAINKIDLSGARVNEVEAEIKNLLGDENAEILKISAKEGRGVKELLDSVVKKVPMPKQENQKHLRALVFDSSYDSYKGVLAYVRVMEGEIKRGDKFALMASGARAEAIEVGVFKPELQTSQNIKAGEIGYIATGFKDVGLCRVGDTITIANWREYSTNLTNKNLDKLASGSPKENSEIKPLAGYQEPKPMIFASFYPSTGSANETQDYNLLRDALGKLKLSDAALFFEPESSDALGRGFKCGFLGMLHLEIVSERLRREYNLNLIVTTPSVVYQLREKGDQEEKNIYSPQQLPNASQIDEIKEPWIKLEIISPSEYLGTIMKLMQGVEGIYVNTQYLTDERIILTYEAPLREIIVDFYDKLKGATSGYASMSYDLIGWRAGDLVCLDILVAGEAVKAFSRIVPRQKVFGEGKMIVERLKEILPAQLFTVALQAAVGGKILARETITARRKDVTGYLYGGDISRKKKLLEKQKKGKKKMLASGKVNIPQDVFLKVLKK